MSIVDRWLLPDGVEDVLPDTARKLEQARRTLLDRYDSWGYEYVIPPMLEFLDSLLTGTGQDLNLKTLKVTDLVSGRTMGVRADMTPQVARIDAHSLNRKGVVRLCYAGTVVHSKADNMLASRTPLHVGAELFGSTGQQADLEIVSMMVDSLASLGVQDVHLELGDVSIFRMLTQDLALAEVARDELFEMIQRKAFHELDAALQSLNLAEETRDQIRQLPMLCGDIGVLDRANDMFKGRSDILARIENLRSVGEALKRRFDDIDLYFDLSELRGYDYHTGIVFAAYTGGSERAVAIGGRYDDIGEVFGRKRGATGFTVRLMDLVHYVPELMPRAEKVVVESNEFDASLWSKVHELRANGYVVVESGEPGQADHVLVKETGGWVLKPPVDR